MTIFAPISRHTLLAIAVRFAIPAFVRAQTGHFSNETVGDLCHYAPWDNLAMFHDLYSWSRGLIRLGRLEQGAKPLLVRGEYLLRVEAL